MDLEQHIEQLQSEAKESSKLAVLDKKDVQKLFLNTKPKHTLDNHRNVVN